MDVFGKGNIMEPQEQTRTCGNCRFSEEAIPPASMYDSVGFDDVRCNIDNSYRSATDMACDDWKPKE